MKPQEITKLEEEINFLENQVAEKEIELLDTKLKIIREFYGCKNPAHIVTGYHDCKDSPIGTCFYDSMEDPAFDDCLVCGNPEERK